MPIQPKTADQPENDIAALPAPPSPTEEIAALNGTIANMRRSHDIELAREQNLVARHREEAAGLQEQLSALLESPLLRVLNNGGNLLEIESRLKVLCEKCAHAETSVKGSMTIKIAVESGRGGDGSVEFAITDTVKQPVEDEGACILWLGRDGKLSESNAKQRDLLTVKKEPRRPSPTDAEKLDAAE